LLSYLVAQSDNAFDPLLVPTAARFSTNPVQCDIAATLLPLPVVAEKGRFMKNPKENLAKAQTYYSSQHPG
jgi:hypothetical protein